MNWSVALLGIGLLCSFGAYLSSVRGFLATFRLLNEEKREAIAAEREFVLVKISDSLKSAFVSLMIASMILYFCLIGGGIYIGITSKTSQDALCALRSDLELRTVQGNKFLKEHPKGIPGIPPKTIKEGIRNQERSIKALGDLSC